MNGDSLDDLDRAILYHLQRNGRKSFADIADAVGVSANTVRNRIDEMEDAEIISGYSVDINYDAAGVQHHYVFVCTVRVSEREQLAADARRLPGVIEVITLMTGTDNVLIVTAGAEKDDVTDLAYAIDELGLAIEREHLIRDHFKQPFSEFQPPEYMTDD